MKLTRRMQRTRRSLHDALLALTVERGYDAVTVQDVLDRAEVARSTFYAHFRDKDDLLLGGFQEADGSLSGVLFTPTADDRAESPDFGIRLFRHIDQQRDLAKAFAGSRSGRMVYDHLRNILVVETRAWLRSRIYLSPRQVPEELVVQHIVGSIFGLLMWWVDHGFPYTPDEMGVYCRQLVSSGLQSVIGDISLTGVPLPGSVASGEKAQASPRNGHLSHHLPVSRERPDTIDTKMAATLVE